MAVSKSINEFPDNAMDILQDIDEYKKFCREYTPWKIFYNFRKTGQVDMSLWKYEKK